MKLISLSVVAAMVSAVLAVPNHMDLAKRTIYTTETVIEQGSTIVKVLDGIVSTTTTTSTTTVESTSTSTSVSFIFTYSGDESTIVSRLSSALSQILIGSGIPEETSTVTVDTTTDATTNTTTTSST
ncbi:hypothetical protein BDB01DRAFT_854646 [Pilobolus umbonatus]|nr:hypothetical protein BDB01DRAFT_854646 [Pilobolus umbonatus]